MAKTHADNTVFCYTIPWSYLTVFEYEDFGKKKTSCKKGWVI